jgi:hypothetical protein
MTKCSGFFVYARIAVKSVGLYEAQKKAPPLKPVGLFDFLDVWGVPKCLTGLSMEMTRNAPQVMGKNYRRTAAKTGRTDRRWFFHLLQASVTPCELASSSPIEGSFMR